MNTSTQTPFKSSTVALLGRPNAGKSTLLNALLEVDLSATSDRPQTTRANIRGIIQLKNPQGEWTGQLVLMDTPGVNFQKGLLERSFHMSIESALEDVDVAVWVADVRQIEKDVRDLEQGRLGEDKVAGWLREALKSSAHQGGKTRWILALTKVDLIEKPTLLPLMERISQSLPEFAEIVPVVATQGLAHERSNVKSLLKVLEEVSSEGPALYPEEAWTDLTNTQLIQNLVREAIFQQNRKEVPYQTDCSVLSFLNPEGGYKKAEVQAVIWVSRSSLKPILVGKGGTRIRDIGTAVRRRYQDITGEDLVLKLFVKVVDKWNTRPALLQELGYAQA